MFLQNLLNRKEAGNLNPPPLTEAEEFAKSAEIERHFPGMRDHYALPAAYHVFGDEFLGMSLADQQKIVFAIDRLAPETRIYDPLQAARTAAYRVAYPEVGIRQILEIRKGLNTYGEEYDRQMHAALAPLTVRSKNRYKLTDQQQNRITIAELQDQEAGRLEERKKESRDRFDAACKTIEVYDLKQKTFNELVDQGMPPDEARELIANRRLETSLDRNPKPDENFHDGRHSIRKLQKATEGTQLNTDFGFLQMRDRQGTPIPLDQLPLSIKQMRKLFTFDTDTDGRIIVDPQNKTVIITGVIKIDPKEKGHREKMKLLMQCAHQINEAISS